MNGIPKPPYAFPLVRHLSWRLSSVLLRTPVTPNQVTLASLIAGLACNAILIVGGHGAYVIAALFFVLCYVLDHCDGELARAKQMCSEFGKHFDTFVDWVVHSGLFLSLGFEESRRSGDDIWLWLGAAAAAGATVNYLIAVSREISSRVEPDGGDRAEGRRLSGVLDHVLFAFRELTRSDFCFIILALALMDALWLLLPAAALGAQAYWLTGLIGRTRRYRV